MSIRVLLVDDDERLHELLSRYLGEHDCVVVHAPDGARGLAELSSAQPDLVLLDMMMPGMDGFEVLRRIRQKSSIPVVMLTAKGDETDRVVGLELGADDYMAKPFEPRELVARIQTVVRRVQDRSKDNVLFSDGLRLETETRRVELDGEGIELTTMEFELLRGLMQGRGRVMSRDRLIEMLRGFDADVYDRSIDMLVSRLREKLGDDPKKPRFIRTVRLGGYQFVGAVSQ